MFEQTNGYCINIYGKINLKKKFAQGCTRKLIVLSCFCCCVNADDIRTQNTEITLFIFICLFFCRVGNNVIIIMVYLMRTGFFFLCNWLVGFALKRYKIMVYGYQSFKEQIRAVTETTLRHCTTSNIVRHLYRKVSLVNKRDTC